VWFESRPTPECSSGVTRCRRPAHPTIPNPRSTDIRVPAQPSCVQARVAPTCWLAATPVRAATACGCRRGGNGEMRAIPSADLLRDATVRALASSVVLSVTTARSGCAAPSGACAKSARHGRRRSGCTACFRSTIGCRPGCWVTGVALTPTSAGTCCKRACLTASLRRPSTRRWRMARSLSPAQ
jgi:hypothetical protein